MFFRKCRRGNKAKLEHKLYLAKETPEPIFDLSECDITEVPQGIYSLCRVFLKESLCLQSNHLNSLSGGGNLADLKLLKILNISHNNFTTIPNDISALVHLQELHASHNSLKTLPDSICSLKNLVILDVSYNNLKVLPDNLGEMVNLKHLDISHNHIKTLPNSIYKARGLKELKLDIEHFQYPPEEVVQRGVESIFQYICDDLDVPYIKTESLSDVMMSVDEAAECFEDDNKFQAKIWELETIKQNRTRAFLEIERNNELLQRQELEMANAQKMNREKLLKDIVEEQDKLDSRLNQLQLEKEMDRFRLIEQLHEDEQNAYVAIEQLLTMNRKPLASLLEFENEEKEKLIAAANAHNENYKRNDILEAMKTILKEESVQLEALNRQRVEASRSILQKEVEWENKLAEIMDTHDATKKDTIAGLLSDMELQKAALGTLLERNDARSWGLVQQVCLVEQKLAALTRIELDRRKLQLDVQVNEFAQKRVELSMLLMDLLEQQDVRRSEIVETLRTLEENWDQKSQDFWMKQYQALLNRIPEGITQAQKNIDPVLAESLLMNGVIHYLPHLAKIMQMDYDVLESVNEEQLIDCGISSKHDRLCILDAFVFYKRHKSQAKKKFEASAPVEQGEASAPPLENLKFIGGTITECVICMDHECQVIFVPCGHIVCCIDCSTTLTECPFCRSQIERKIMIRVQ